MLVFDINNNDHTYNTLLKDIAAQLELPYNDDYSLTISGEAGTGTVRTFKLFDELQVLLLEAKFNMPVKSTRAKSDKRYYILHFDLANITDTVKITIDNEQLKKSNTRHAAARLTCNLFMNSEELPAGIHFRSVKILFDEAWLRKYMGLDENTNVLQKYLSLKTESFDIEKLDKDYLKLIDELWNVKQEDPLHQLYLQNRVSLLMERFFRRLYNKMNLLEGKFTLTEDEVQRLIQVEHLLVNDFTEMPPTIDQFSKMISMSTTKLKKSFKEMYGDSIYSYYQKLRMQKAKELLTSGRYNVKTAAEAIGYDNTSNFILAFKKQFNISPGEVLAGV